MNRILTASSASPTGHGGPPRGNDDSQAPSEGRAQRGRDRNAAMRSVERSSVHQDAALLELRDVSKSFGATVALRNINLRLEAGLFHALLGQNGAGKSTIVKILAGIHRVSRGDILVEGRHVDRPTPATVRSLGLAIVHQDSSVLPGMTVERNFALGQEPTGPFGLIDRRAVRHKLAARGARFGAEFDPDMPAGLLSTAERKTLEILKVLDEQQKLLVLDEPTAFFTTEETRRLLGVLLELKASGTSILYVTHRLDEIEGIVDRVTVLRDGLNVGDLARDEAVQERVISLMVGRSLGEMYPQGSKPVSHDLLFSARGIGLPGAFQDVNLEVRRGEIVALVGLAGHGSFDVARSVVGIQPPEVGELQIDGRPMKLRSLRDALRYGIGYLGEDRAENILRVRPVRENLALAALESWSRMGFVDERREAAEANNLIAALSIRCQSVNALAESLSGGNQQKLAFGRWLAADRRLLVLLDPTAGIDVGARAEIYKHLRDFADGGRGVLIATSDLAEAVGFADTVVAFYKGRQLAVFPREGRRKEDVLAAITGHRVERVTA